MRKRKERGIDTRTARAGFTFVELMVGVALLAVLITALAGSSIYSSNTMVRSKLRLETTLALQSELEYVLSQPYDSVVDGSRTTEVGESSWTVQDNGTYKQILIRFDYSPVGGDTIKDSIVTFRQAP